jgi:hypothetical protein
MCTYKKSSYAAKRNFYTYKKSSYAHIKRVALPQYGTFLQYGTLFVKQDYIVTNKKVFEASFAFKNNLFALLALIKK